MPKSAFIKWTLGPRSRCGTLKRNCEILTPDRKSQREKLKKLVQAKKVVPGACSFLDRNV